MSATGGVSTPDCIDWLVCGKLQCYHRKLLCMLVWESRVLGKRA